MSGDVTGADESRLERRLGELAAMGRLCAGIVAKGEEAYLEDSLDGQILRAAGREQIIEISTVVQKLPEEFKLARPEIEWVAIQRLRNLVAHHYDRVQDEFVLQTLRTRVPDLIERLGLPRAP